MSMFLRVGALVLGLVITVPGSALAATFTVNSTANTADAAVGNGICAASLGVCTLRAAIQEANFTVAADIIKFAIGTGPQRISALTSLPTITQPVTIDGATQPGFAGVPLIEIEGLSGTAVDGILVTGGNTTLRSLVINRFLGDGVRLSVKGGNVIEGCYIGTTADGLEPARNLGSGIRIETFSNRIGGTFVQQRNVISGNGGLGIEGGITIFGETAVGNKVQGNFIGLDATGLNPIGNLGRGIAIHFASFNLIGGSEPGAGNLIAGNRASGVRIMSSSTGNIVQKNWIGINKNGQIGFGTYPEPGTLSNARGVQVRGDGNYVLDNIIAGNTEDGVLCCDGTGRDLIPAGYPSNNLVQNNVIFQNGFNGIGAFVGEKNKFVHNTIFSNGHLGINLENRVFGLVTPNDLDDTDEGTNVAQNFPEIVVAYNNGTQTSVAGFLRSTPSASYTIELFSTPKCSPSGYGEATYPLQQSAVSTNAAGNAQINIVLPYAVPKGWFMTMTATDALGNTSELSACAVIR
jgi:CSLREA domain-containing protein